MTLMTVDLFVPVGFSHMHTYAKTHIKHIQQVFEPLGNKLNRLMISSHLFATVEHGMFNC